MKLYNALIIYDMFVVANSEEEARETLIANINTSGEPTVPTEQVAFEITHERGVRDSWREQSPFVGGSVTDEEFASIKGKKTFAIFKQIYTKDK